MTGSRGGAVHTPCFRRWHFGRGRALLLLLREGLGCELRQRAAVLDRAGELDQRLQGLHQPCGLL